MDSELRSMLVQTAQIQKVSGYSYGRPTHSSAVTISTYFEQEYRVIKNKAGQEVVSKGFAVVEPTVSIDVEDLFIYEGTTHEIISVLPFIDVETGTLSHKEVYI